MVFNLTLSNGTLASCLAFVATQQECPGFNSLVGGAFLCGVRMFSPYVHGFRPAVWFPPQSKNTHSRVNIWRKFAEKVKGAMVRSGFLQLKDMDALTSFCLNLEKTAV